MNEVTAEVVDAPEPDWVAELCGIKDTYVEIVPHTLGHEVRLVRKGYEWFNDGADLAYGIGPTPALAAKACVERLRNQTPNPAACGGDQ